MNTREKINSVTMQIHALMAQESYPIPIDPFSPKPKSRGSKIKKKRISKMFNSTRRKRR